MNFTKKIGTSFTRSDVEQMKGIEPSYSAWEADILPLKHLQSYLYDLVYTNRLIFSIGFYRRRCIKKALRKIAIA